MNQSLFASMMNNTSKSAINPDVMIDIDLIDPYPFNEVLSPQNEDEQLFESLVDDIREYGLEQTIELRDMKNGRYQSLGGNRRCAAIRYLVNQENPQDLRFVKASVAPDSDLEAKRVCIASNNYGEKSEYSNLQEIKSYRKLSETQVNTYQTILNKGTVSMYLCIVYD